MTSRPPLIYWFRQDLRLADHPGLTAALHSGHPVLPLFIHDTSPGLRPLGGASRWWLHHSLAALNASLNGALVLRSGPAEDALRELIAQTGACGVYWGRCYEPAALTRDARLKKNLRDSGFKAESFNTALLFEPWEMQTKLGGPYQVFTPFWKACLARGPLPEPIATPKAPQWASAPSEKLADWALCPTQPDWASGLRATWTPGEAGARTRLLDFADHHLNGYATNRDLPAEPATSRLSPHLHWGEISPRQIAKVIKTAELAGRVTDAHDVERYLAELGWREFAHHLLYHFPTLPEQPLNKKYQAFPWLSDEVGLKCWQRGLTGYPIVDAGLRELWQTGWMHNRVRMIVGSFLVKDLLIHWREGEAWFWDTLVDADLANNTASWQWIAGCGADAAPYFRVFNPTLQGEKFDPSGAYVRRYVPEIAGLSNEYVHRPWEAPADVLGRANLTLGRDYPHPVVDHNKARARALAALATLKEAQNG